MSNIETLNEGLVLYKDDQTYRRQGKHIIIAQMESIVPLHSVMDPNIWGGGISSYTWKRVQEYYYRYPGSRKGQFPQHYYAEYLEDDYVVYVGCPLTNKSWFLQEAVATGVLPIVYGDAILIVLQENYGVEVTDKRLWRILAHATITPLMKMFDIPRSRVQFFENLANRDAINSPDWKYRFREPIFLDPIILDLFLKDFEKR